LKEIKAVGKQSGRMPGFMLNDAESVVEASLVLEEIQRLENKKKKLAKKFHAEIDFEIDVLNGQLENIIEFTSAKQVDNDIDIVKRLTDRVRVYKTDEDGSVEEKM
jgi:hypothetical protein